MLKFQDHIAEATVSAAKEAFKYARSVPAEKLDWKPADTTRSVMSLCRELAMTPTWAIDLIEHRPMPDEAEAEASKKEQESWDTVDACESECLKRLEPLVEVMKAMPDERLSETKWLPYDGGRDFTMVEMMDYPRWNFTYHLGQIAYIQTLYGDIEMH